MSHYINLLEEAECRYFSAAESSVALKAGAGAGVLLVLVLVVLSVRSLGASIEEADRMSRRWKEIEPLVEEARVRNGQLQRMERAHGTLMGWSATRLDWAGVLGRIQEDLPGPAERFQFTRLYFDEEIQGLRNVRAGDPPRHPLVRTGRIEIRGLVAGFRTEAAYEQYELRLIANRGGQPSPFAWARLDNSSLQEEFSTPERPVSLFNFTLNLTPRELAP
jgi:hypothetical protein